MDNRKIGVFDSGLGGLTVVREVRDLMPEESIVYFGDTARLPYGAKSKESIIGFSHQIMHFLLEQDVKAVIVACGTASSNALKEIQAAYDVPIIGVVEPGAKAAVRKSRTGHIGVLGTSATIRSKAFETLILEQKEKDVTVTSMACPLFVPLVESGWFEDPITSEVVKRYLDPIKGKVDTLVLGCTHYPLLKDAIREEMGEDVSLINVSREAVKEMKAYLAENGLAAGEGSGGVASYEFYASDSIESFRDFCETVLGERRLKVDYVNIEQYPSSGNNAGDALKSGKAAHDAPSGGER